MPAVVEIDDGADVGAYTVTEDAALLPLVKLDVVWVALSE